ncbi:MAG TPA: hypothetical protein VFI46_01850 [Jiangellaceae bacterium]|nr:hypothetical protein [Jiangellaceae bacterium]
MTISWPAEHLNFNQSPEPSTAISSIVRPNGTEAGWRRTGLRRGIGTVVTHLHQPLCVVLPAPSPGQGETAVELLAIEPHADVPPPECVFNRHRLPSRSVRLR